MTVWILMFGSENVNIQEGEGTQRPGSLPALFGISGRISAYSLTEANEGYHQLLEATCPQCDSG